MNLSKSLKSDFDWYVACCEHGKEAQAADHLRSVGFDDTFVPLILSDRTTRRATAPRTNPLRRGYVFCETLLFTSGIWHLACPADGLRHHGLVKGFLGGWPAAPVANACIKDMRARCDADGVYVKVEESKVYYLPGALVRVLEDSFVGQVFRVIFDTDAGLNLQAVQGVGYSVYIRDRRKVEAIQTSVSPPKFGWEAVPNGTKKRRNRMRVRRVAA